MKVSTSTIRRNGCSRMVKLAFWPDQRVGLVKQRVEILVQQPSLLNELELTRDVRVQADEQQSALGIVVVIAIGERGAEFATAPQDAVIVRGVQQGLRRGYVPREAVARIGPAYMRTERAADALGIVMLEAEIVLRLTVSIRRQTTPPGHSRWPSMVAADYALGEPVGGHMRRARDRGPG